MSGDRFSKGLTNIRDAIETALVERRVKDALVELALEGDAPANARFSVTVGDKSEAQSFVREEIEDSGEAIDAPVAVKVRMLVSHFVR